MSPPSMTSTTTTTTTTSPTLRPRQNPHGKSTPFTSTIARPISEQRLEPFLNDTVQPKPTLRVKIDDCWYDLSKWQKTHPGGVEVLQFMDGLDATDAFYSLHSEEAIARLKRMPSQPAKVGDTPPPSQATLNFRKFRQQLRAEGWFNRQVGWELFYTFEIFFFALFGTYLALHLGMTFWGSLSIAVAMQQAGWVGHDFTHGRGTYCKVMGYIHSGFINALSRAWWSRKHNTHHVYTNHLGIDMDIENDPVLFLFFPSGEKDVFYRRYQHLYYCLAYSFLYVSWRIQSFQYAWKRRIVPELVCMSVNFAWLIYLGPVISALSILMAGFLVAIVVTVTHQSEEMFGPEELKNFSFVEGQFLSTRDAFTTNPIMNFLWGGMQYQLEHHLFPTMPKYKYAALTERVKQFAKENGIEYRVESVMDVWRRNLRTIKFFAGERPKNI